MKPLFEKPFEPIMRFFTPELFVEFNSENDEVADRAAGEWEEAIRKYKNHLEIFVGSMSASAKKLSKLCLHDAELLAFEQSDESFFPHRFEPFFLRSGVAILSLKQDGGIVSLFYALWDGVRRYQPKEGWPFSKKRPHWLFDEIDVLPGPFEMFCHRILFSDGIVIEIPFASTMIHRLKLEGSDGGKPSKVSA